MCGHTTRPSDLGSSGSHISDCSLDKREVGHADIEAHEDLDDSARAESIISGTSTSSFRSPAATAQDSRDLDVGDASSTIRRQSVIIEGLSLETEELKKKIIKYEEEASSLPVLSDLQGKLNSVETKLEETETFAYQEMVLKYFLYLTLEHFGRLDEGLEIEKEGSAILETPILMNGSLMMLMP